MVKVLIFTAGNFSSKTAEHALRDGHEVTFYIRPSSLKRRTKDLDSFKKKGAKVITGSMDEVDKIRDVAKDMDIIVCCFSHINNGDLNDQDIYNLYMQEANIIKAIEGLNIKRYVPNQFAHFSHSDGHEMFVAKSNIRKLLKYSSVPHTNIHCGWIMDIIEIFTQEYFINDDQKFYLSSFNDVCKNIIKIAIDDRTLNKDVYICGDLLSQVEVLQICNINKDNLLKIGYEDLQNQIKDKKSKNISTVLENYIISNHFSNQGSELGGSLLFKDLYPEEQLTSFSTFHSKNTIDYIFPV